MRSYKEYYKLALEEHKTWLAMPEQQNEWWKKDEYGRLNKLTVQGSYLPGTKFISIEEKNDTSLFVNHTNVKNSEWSFLFAMLGQALVDWCVENGKKNFWAFNIYIKRVVDGLVDIYDPVFDVWDVIESNGCRVEITDKKELKSWEGCRNALCDIIWEFIYTHKGDIPEDWNRIGFGLDDLSASIEAKEWVCFSDGYINVGCYHNDDYDSYVECM